MTKSRTMTRRHSFLLGLATLTGMGTFPVEGIFRHLNNQIRALGDEKRDEAVVIGDTPLRTRAAAKGLIYGAAAQYSTLSSDAEFAARFAQECAILVPENELKWGELRPSPDRFNFAPGDWMAEFARAHNILFRGHNLLWHKSLPPWFEYRVNKQNARQVLLEHIETVVRHYAGKIHSWDVVNEAIEPRDGRSDSLRNTPWLHLLGPDYIDIAFRAAAKADPQTLLVYNDYGTDYDTPDEEARRTAVLRLLERLKSIGTPVHALGVQAHLNGNESRFNARKLKAFLHDVASLGLKILVTEMDVTDQKLPKATDVRDRTVAKAYNDYLSVVLDEPAVIAVLTWGLSDRYTWLCEYKPRQDKAPVRTLPLDAQLKRKLAWNAIAHNFDRIPQA